MTRIHTNAKYVTEMLNAAEKGDDISIYVEESGQGHYRGEVIATDDEDLPNNADVKVTIDDGELTHEVYSRYVGADDDSHTMSDGDDYEVFALAGREHEVSALATRDDSEAPDLTVEELDPADRDEIIESSSEELETTRRAMTELQAMRQAFEDVLGGDSTIAEVEEKMVDVQMDSGGKLVLDSR